MRALLFGFCFAGILAGQSEIPGDQCLGGTLISIQPDSITLKFNDKITTFRLAPDTEIWRRGTDVESIHQLVVGEDINIRCTRSGDGTIVASVVAAAEKGHAVYMEPHHLHEFTLCGGHLVGFTKDTLSVKNDDGVCVMHINPDTVIWRGEIFHDTSPLRLGDDLVARVTVGYPNRELTADEICVNITKVEGKIVSVRPDRIVVKDHGHVTALFDSRTTFDLDQGKLEKGAYVMAIGLDLGQNTFRATSVVVEK